MAEKTIETRLKVRGDTASNWSSVNPTLLKNEIGYDETNKKFKIGDGTTPWNSLSYIESGSSSSVSLEPIYIGEYGNQDFEIDAFALDITAYQKFLQNKTAPIRVGNDVFQLGTFFDDGDGRYTACYVLIRYEQIFFIDIGWYADGPSIEGYYAEINGSEINYVPEITSGTKVGTLLINGDGHEIYAPVGGGSSVKITYNELKNLRASGQLVPGMQYQITDYQCTTTQQYTRSARHQFDIIVTADNEYTLNESARATYHDGDIYFSQQSAKNLYDTSGCSFLGDEEDINITVFGYQYEYDDADVDITDNYPEGEIQGDSGTDIFMAVDYKVNPHGFISPIIYKTDYDQDSEADYGDEFWYAGKYDIDGITYDRWLKKELDDMENIYNFTDGIVRKYVLTNEIVDNDIILIEGSTRVFNVNMNAWELKYCLDNDNSRFIWADVTGTGRGVIYYMKDEYGNECPYDFKNIMFKRAKNKISSSDTTHLYGGRYIHSDANSILWSHNDSTFGSSNDSKYFYTFSNYNSDDEAVTDLTVSPFTLLEGESELGAYGSKEILKTENNKIEKTTITTTTASGVTQKVQMLNDIVFVLHSSIMVSVIPKNNFWIKLFRNNTIKENCFAITIYDFAIDNTIGYGNNCVVIGFFSNNNKLGVGNKNIGIFGSDDNTIENSCEEVFIYTHNYNYDVSIDATKLNAISNIKFMNNCQNITLRKGGFVGFENVTILANSHDYNNDVPKNVYRYIDSKFYLVNNTSPLSEYCELYTEE